MTEKLSLPARWRAGLAACLFAVLAMPPLQAHADAATLRARHVELAEQLRNNPYQRAMYIDSAASDSALQGEVFAVLDHPFSKLSGALKDPAQWCDILILPFNTKYCHAEDQGSQARLAVRIGRKYDQPVEQAYRVAFTQQTVAATPNYLESRLMAREGPIGTRDYRIVVSAIPLAGGRSFLHLTYSYAFGVAGRLAMQAYLATAGSDKIGFTVVGRDASGRPQYIRGVRGAVERNVMRYYLAIDAHLDSLDAPREQQVEQRIQSWFSATERYSRQLHEMDRNTYAAMKRQEYERQQTASVQ